MTVLVSAVRQMISRRPAGPGHRLRLDRRHVGRAGGLRRGRRHPRHRPVAAGQGLGRAAAAAASPTARSCCRSIPTSTAAWRIVQRLAAEEGVYLANSMNSLRLEGQKTVSIEIVQQWDWQVPDVDHHPGRQPGQRQRARRRVRHDAGARRGQQAAAHRRRPGGARQPAVPGLHERLELRRRCRRRATLASAIQIGNPVSIRKAIRTLQALRRHRRAGHRERAGRRRRPRADRTGMFNCPHTGVALAVLEKLVGARRDHRATERVVVDLHGQRPEVHRLQAAVPHAPARRHRCAAVEHARRVAQRLRRGAPGDRHTCLRPDAPARVACVTLVIQERHATRPRYDRCPP